MLTHPSFLEKVPRNMKKSRMFLMTMKVAAITKVIVKITMTEVIVV